MIRIPHESGRPVAVLGLGKSGLVAARALAASGAEVWAWDDDAAKRAAIATTDLYHCDWSRPSALVLSPGIPHEFPKPHPVAAKAKAAHVPVIGEVELLFRAQPKATFIGITGTNGKSTTTALIGHILRRSGKRAEVGANLGTPALALAPLGDGGIYVLEMSSYQLELVPTARFDVAVLLNITPDHLDRHGGMAGYVAAKRHIFDRQRCAGLGGHRHRRRILPRHPRWPHQPSRGGDCHRPRRGGRHRPRGRQHHHRGDGILSDESGRAIMDLATAPALPGPHNWQNAAAAFAVGRALGISSASIAAGIETYPGLPHRQELIDTGAGVRFINDSKATNADATAKALACYEPIYWILGGRPKENGLEGLEPFYPRIARAYLIGEAAPAFGKTLDANHVATRQCGTLDRAVAEAAADAAKEGRAHAVVLLSPACASFDQFANFEERGNRFRALVQGLGQKAGRA